MNQVTHFLDGSMVYGSTSVESRKLRAKEKGLLKMQGNNLLPVNPTANDKTCKSKRKKRGVGCFLAGKISLPLLILHIIKFDHISNVSRLI